jgi:hypothetical protein
VQKYLPRYKPAESWKLRAWSWASFEKGGSNQLGGCIVYYVVLVWID